MTASSGSPALDAQTCRVVSLRAKFTPARGRSGTPIESTYQQHISWRIGDEPASSEPWLIRWIVNKGDKGMPSCRSETGAVPDSVNAGPERCPAYIAGIPGWSANGLEPGTILVEQRFAVGATPSMNLGPADKLVARELARLEVDAAGQVSSCKIVESVGAMPPQLPRTCSIVAKHYAPRKDSAGSPVPFTAYFMVGVYTRAGAQTVSAP